MLKKIVLGLVAVVAVLAIVIALQSPEYRVTRTTTIAAPAPVVFAQVNDFHNWQSWSPWAKLDPAMTQSFAGAAAGTGAVYSWAGNAEVGEGRMTVIDSRPHDVIRIRLEFFKPFPSTNAAEFTFRPEGDRTAVTWSVVGEKTFVTKGIFMFVDVDKELGKYFEQGLVQMKSIAEAGRKS
jgi:hypothetical protein